MWERNIALQLQVHALTEERGELIRRQTADLETTLGLHNQMAELRQERDQLQQQLDEFRAPASFASEVRQTAREWKVMADRLKGDADRIRIERGKLQDQAKELQAANQQQTKDLTRANFTIDIFREQIEKLKQTAQPEGPVSQALATPSGSRLPTHHEMGGHM